MKMPRAGPHRRRRTKHIVQTGDAITLDIVITDVPGAGIRAYHTPVVPGFEGLERL